MARPGVTPEQQKRILEMAREGRSTSEISFRLDIPERTVRLYRKRLGVAGNRPRGSGARQEAADANVRIASSPRSNHHCEVCGEPVTTTRVNGRLVVVDVMVADVVTYKPGSPSGDETLARVKHAKVCLLYQLKSGKVRPDQPMHPPVAKELP